MDQQLPGHFAYSAEHGYSSHLWPITYELERDGFDVAGVFVPTKEFSPYTFNVYEHDLGDGDVSYDDIAQYTLLLPNIGGPIAGPQLHAWAAENSDRVTEDIPRLMHEVYTQFYEDPEDVAFSLDTGHRGFAARTRADGALNLQVLGDCACMGVSQMGHALQGMEQGFAEYEFHNTDMLAQTVSLYAGLGHIARLASGRDLNQMKLF